jgi:hypothetical protein
MTRCLDEATLQSYFDGELSRAMMESTTSHLAACPTCAATARDIEEEINLMTVALADDFEVSVPTERLRQRIDAAVLDHRIGVASAPAKTGFGAFVSALLSFGTQRTLGYASLAVVLAFGVILGLVKFRTPVTPVENQQVAVVTPKVEEVKPDIPETVIKTESTDVRPTSFRPVSNRPVRNTPKTTPTPEAAHVVKLLPGERSYLQTIARLDTTIKANQKSMRPSLQVEYQRNLAVVDRAIAATRSAAKSNPNDPDVADFMFAAYQSKVDLLNTIADARVGGGRPH